MASLDSLVDVFSPSAMVKIPPLPKPVMVFRMTSLDESFVDEMLSERFKYDPAFLSSSFSPWFADTGFGGVVHPKYKILSTIILPKGFSYGFPVFKHSEFSKEHEMLIGPGALFKVLSGVKNENERIVRLKLLYVGNAYDTALETVMKEQARLDEGKFLSYNEFILQESKKMTDKEKQRLKDKYMTPHWENGEKILGDKNLKILVNKKKRK